MTDYRSINLEPFFSAYKNDTVVKAIVGEISGNGHQVFVMGIPAYLPKTQQVPGATVSPGDEVMVTIIKIMPETNNVVVSAKEAAKLLSQKKAQDLKVGDIVSVKVKSIIDYGVFVSISEGVDGMIPLKELSYNKIHAAEEVVAVGDEFKARVEKLYEKDGKLRIELSRKQALPDPWESLSFQVGDIVDGTVTNIVDYGAFLNVGPVTGMLHRSELTWSLKDPNPKEYLSVGDKLRIKIINLDKENKKMAVSLREAKGDPWLKMDLEVGAIVEASILNKTKSGFMVGQKDGIGGLLHKYDLAWLNDDQKALMETLKVGDTVRVVVTSIDKAKRKLGFSMKHLEPHPFDTFVSDHPLGTTLEATVLWNNIPGTMRVNLPIGKFQIFFPPELKVSWEEIKEQYPEAGTITVTIKSYDPESKRIEFAPAI